MKILIGNIFDSKAQTIVNTVNCVGVMGKGIALEFKKRFPEMFNEYKDKCDKSLVKPGVPYIYSNLLGGSIINFPTKDHWRSSSHLEFVVKGLDIFLEKYQDWGVKSVAFPPLGCGNGGLEWEMVGRIMYQKLSNLDVPVSIYAPFGTPPSQIKEDFLSAKVEIDVSEIKGKHQSSILPEWYVLLEVMYRLQRQTYANPVGRVIFQKLCYILTLLGLKTDLNFVQHSYGPFSADIKEMINILANANLISEVQLGKMNAIRVTEDYKNIRDKYNDIIIKNEKNILRTVDLFCRIRNTDQAEEIATVIYSVHKLKKDFPYRDIEESEVLDFILNSWKSHWADKKDAISNTIRNLVLLKWIKLKFSDSLDAVQYF
ncbi:MAG TPA: Appr-1-p processing protein [Lentisphaeria bacterium]|nr:Appr-1-p processing protein [Lentisphaeria bacterium]